MTEEALKQLETQVGEVMARKFAEQSDELRNGLLTEDQLKTNLEAYAKANDIEEVNKKIDEKIEEVLIEMKKQTEAKENAKPKTLAKQLEAKHEEMKKGIESKAGSSAGLPPSRSSANSLLTSPRLVSVLSASMRSSSPRSSQKP
jgi:hypothetical protein